MSNRMEKILLVGDNPFHGISHLSQERARSRGSVSTFPENAADLVITSLENGANGFMFSVNDLTLSILRIMREKVSSPDLYAMIPYAFEYVRVVAQTGTPGLAKKFVKQIAVSGNLRAVVSGLKAAVTADPAALLKTYLTYELSRIRSSASKQANLKSVLLNEVVTDMALALDLDWLFKSYLDFMLKLRIKPGFNTRNFPYMIRKFREWNMDLSQVIVAAPFNKVGFQMNPSRRECEKVLADLSVPTIIAISILAAGYLKPAEAAAYIATLPNISGIVVGVSKEQHARETFELFRKGLC